MRPRGTALDSRLLQSRTLSMVSLAWREFFWVAALAGPRCGCRRLGANDQPAKSALIKMLPSWITQACSIAGTPSLRLEAAGRVGKLAAAAGPGRRRAGPRRRLGPAAGPSR
jgi:hypothetical protein